MSKSTDTIDVAERIATLREEVAQVLRALCQIEIHQIQDDRAYSGLDLIEAVDVTEQIVASRLAGSFLEWKHDDKQHYKALLQSIGNEIKEANMLLFVTTSGKSLRFVSSYNSLIVDRLVELFKLIGPSGTKALINPFIQDMKNTVSGMETVDPTDLHIAQSLLESFRKAPVKKKLTKEERLHVIRNVCERIKEEAA
jgi:hypothetical protein